MMIGLIGKKLGMTHIFNEAGQIIPVTVVQAGPCDVIQVKTKEKEGYSALQLSFGERRDSLFNKPIKGHYARAKLGVKSTVKEFRIDSTDEYECGQQLTVEVFSLGERVDVSGISKGKGFQGVIKRHNFHRGPKTHGSHSYRRTGSIGASADPSRVVKGKKMPGRMGNANVTAKNLEVVRIDKGRNVILLRGAIPGAINGVVKITKHTK
jgi:large subunit ribosomal protein L3